MTSPRPRFSVWSLRLVLTVCALAGVNLLLVIGLPVFGVQPPAVLVHVMHVLTVVMPLGSACLLGYAAIREQRTQHQPTPPASTD